MSLKRREFTAEFKLGLLREAEAGKSIAQLAREHKINPNLIYRWKERLATRGADAFLGAPEDAGTKIAHLERLIGQLTVENAFFKTRLQPARTKKERLEMTRAIADMLPCHGERHLTRLLSAASLSRATYYRLLKAAGAERTPEDEVLLRAEIHKVALDWPSYGYRRITHELSRRGARANHKRVLRLMREDGLLCRRKPSFAATTDSGHDPPRYADLAGEMEVSRLDQLWVADITYVRLPKEYVYLAVVLDAYSRRVIGWALERSLETDLPLEALQMALRSRRLAPGLVHHSDQGVQYASLAYTSLLEEHGVAISMSRRACPYDNAQAEGFMKTIKYEEVYASQYESFGQARRSIGAFIEGIYNEKRLHSALGYRPPAEFENMLLASPTTP